MKTLNSSASTTPGATGNPAEVSLDRADGGWPWLNVKAGGGAPFLRSKSGAFLFLCSFLATRDSQPERSISSMHGPFPS